MKKLFLVFFSLVSFLRIVAQTTLTEAPNIETKMIDGTSFFLYETLESGKFVAIYFYSTTCYSCREYAPHFNEAYFTFNSNQNNVFFIAIEKYGTNNDVREFNETYNIDVPSVSGINGQGGRIHENFGISITPTTILINHDKQIVEQHIYPPTAENIIEIIQGYGGLTVGLEEFETKNDNSLLVFPNPFFDALNLTFSSEKDGFSSVKIIDTQMNTLFETTIKTTKGKNKSQIDLQNLKDGMYFVSLITPEGNHLTQKVVKKSFR
ncbi:MAG: T9SS type A sorting domain-containing protein [Lentimicrobiaceae bacterium]|jgi:thiol-disulfide isomerase/thioredoxin|nr:T9SS type A sorting domain-containing protein [Lentimicrobiaceae bacterium]